MTGLLWLRVGGLAHRDGTGLSTSFSNVILTEAAKAHLKKLKSS